MKTMYVVVKVSLEDGVQLSSVFHNVEIAGKYAYSYGGSVRPVSVYEDAEVARLEQAFKC